MNRSELITLAANGNAAAEHFLQAFSARAHFLDDVADSDKHAISPTNIAAAEADWLMCLSGNPFFQKHSNMLVPVMLCGLNAWADSNNMPPGDIRDVVKGIWHEVVYVVAWLTGGWAHMRIVSANREYDIERINSIVRDARLQTEEEVRDGTLR